MSEKLFDIGTLLQSVPLEQSLLNFDVPARKLTTFGVGAAVPVVFTPRSISDIQRVWADFYKRQIPYKILGAGSNVILPDQPLNCAVLQLGRAINGIKTVALDCDLSTRQLMLNNQELSAWSRVKKLPVGSFCRLYVLAGTLLSKLSSEAAKEGLSGLEFCAGIPASVGGALCMNAGVQSGSMSDVVEAAVCLHRDGTPEVITNEGLGFGYRSSKITPDMLVIGVVFKLTKSNPEEVMALYNQKMNYRVETQPLKSPSAGSIFKNPSKSIVGKDKEEKLFAGKLLEEAGLKGMRFGDICFSDKHANWLIRVGDDAQTSYVVSLIKKAQEVVFERFGVELELEVELW